MRELVFEILLRLAKALAAAVVGLVVWLVAVGILGAEGSVSPRTPVLAEWRGLHPPRGGEPDLTRRQGSPTGGSRGRHEAFDSPADPP